MFKDNIIVCLLMFFSVLVFISSLPVDALIKIQPLIAALIAFLAALVAYFSTLNSVHEKERISEERHRKSKAEKKFKYIQFLLLDLKDLVLVFETFKEMAEEALTEKHSGQRATIAMIKNRLVWPETLSQSYKEYFFLDEKTIERLSHLLWFKTALQDLTKTYDVSKDEPEPAKTLDLLKRQLDNIETTLLLIKDLIARLEKEAVFNKHP